MSTGVDTRPVPVSLLRWPRTRDLVTQYKGILMYLWAHPEQTACGCYLFPLDATAADLSMSSSSLADALAEFHRRKLIDLDHATGEIMLPDWFRWYKPHTPAACGAVESSIKKILSLDLREKVEKSYKSIAPAWKGKEKEKGKEAAARASARTAADAAASAQGKQDQGRRRRGDEAIRHGVEVWTPADAEGLQALIDRHGEERVEEVAGGLTPAAGHRAPYLSAVVAAFQALASAEAQIAAEAMRQARLAVTPPIDPDARERGAQILATLRGRRRNSIECEEGAT